LDKCPKLFGQCCTEPLKGRNECPLKKATPISDYRCFNFQSALEQMKNPSIISIQSKKSEEGKTE
jgi:hypothetical protein